MVRGERCLRGHYCEAGVRTNNVSDDTYAGLSVTGSCFPYFCVSLALSQFYASREVQGLTEIPISGSIIDPRFARLRSTVSRVRWW
jgi:hypothetical protein